MRSSPGRRRPSCGPTTTGVAGTTTSPPPRSTATARLPGAGAARQPLRASKGFIDHTTLDFTSMLKFIEQNWGLKPLASRDREAGRPSSTRSTSAAAAAPSRRVPVDRPCHRSRCGSHAGRHLRGLSRHSSCWASSCAGAPSRDAAAPAGAKATRTVDRRPLRPADAQTRLAAPRIGARARLAPMASAGRFGIRFDGEGVPAHGRDKASPTPDYGVYRTGADGLARLHGRARGLAATTARRDRPGWGRAPARRSARVYVRQGQFVRHPVASFLPGGVRLRSTSRVSLGATPAGSNSTVTVKSIQGKHYTFRGDTPRWLQGSRVVTQNTGAGFRLKQIDYASASRSRWTCERRRLGASSAFSRAKAAACASRCCCLGRRVPASRRALRFVDRVRRSTCRCPTARVERHASTARDAWR